MSDTCWWFVTLAASAGLIVVTAAASVGVLAWLDTRDNR